MRVLNCYSGLGGNRKLWTGVQVTAVEKDPEIARAYSDSFPEDKMIIGDAHEYLFSHHHEFDFIWSSPPCPTHSRANFWRRGVTRYPDMSLYQQIILLRHSHKGRWVVENVVPYYEPLIPAQKVGRHLFWTNFTIGNFEIPESFSTIKNSRTAMENEYGFNLDGYKIDRKDRKLRNCVHPEIGLHILNRARGILENQTEQAGLFQ